MAKTLIQRFDEYLAQPRDGRVSPLKGTAYQAVFCGYWWGVLPAFGLAVASAETTFGTAPNTGTDVNPGHNAWGIGPHRQYPNWAKGWWEFNRIIRVGYLDEGLETVDEIAVKYVGYESRWPQTVKAVLRELGLSAMSADGTMAVGRLGP
jgi:hypothetical protein